MDELSHWLHITYSPDSNAEDRRKAYEYTNYIKSQSAECFKLSMEILAFREADTILLHFGIHCAEHIVTSGWNYMNDDEKIYLKNTIITIVKDCYKYQNAKKYIYEDVAKLAVAIALREWPHNWNNFHEELLSCVNHDNNINEYQSCRMVLSIIRNLCDKMNDYTPNLPDKRKNEVKNALTNTINTHFFNFFIITFKKYITILTNGNNSNEIIDIINLILETFTSFAGWIDPTIFYNHNILSLCLPLFLNIKTCAKLQNSW